MELTKQEAVEKQENLIRWENEQKVSYDLKNQWGFFIKTKKMEIPASEVNNCGAGNCENQDYRNNLPVICNSPARFKFSIESN